MYMVSLRKKEHYEHATRTSENTQQPTEHLKDTKHSGFQIQPSQTASIAEDDGTMAYLDWMRTRKALAKVLIAALWSWLTVYAVIVTCLHSRHDLVHKDSETNLFHARRNYSRSSHMVVGSEGSQLFRIQPQHNQGLHNSKAHPGYRNSKSLQLFETEQIAGVVTPVA